MKTKKEIWEIYSKEWIESGSIMKDPFVLKAMQAFTDQETAALRAKCEKQGELIEHYKNISINAMIESDSYASVSESSKLEQLESELDELQEGVEITDEDIEVDYTEINKLLNKGLRLAAIKLHYQTYGGSLKDSKAICDKLYYKIKSV